jgi:hypothetical protein
MEVNGHLVSLGPLPTISVINAGISSVTVAAGSTDQAGRITFVTTAAGIALQTLLFQVNFGMAWAYAPIVLALEDPLNVAPVIQLRAQGPTTVSFVISNEAALPAQIATYSLSYLAMGKIA